MQEAHNADHHYHQHSLLQQKLLVVAPVDVLQQEGAEEHLVAGYHDAISQEMQSLCNMLQ